MSKFEMREKAWLKHSDSEVGCRKVADKTLIYFPLLHPGHKGYRVQR